MTLRRYEQGDAAVRFRDRDIKTTFRQSGRKQQMVCGRSIVAYGNEQGNCIDSFRSNRQQVPISLFRESPNTPYQIYERNDEDE